MGKDMGIGGGLWGGGGKITKLIFWHEGVLKIFFLETSTTNIFLVKKKTLHLRFWGGKSSFIRFPPQIEIFRVVHSCACITQCVVNYARSALNDLISCKSGICLQKILLIFVFENKSCVLQSLIFCTKPYNKIL